MSEQLRQFIIEVTGASFTEKVDVIQSIWNGYGEISRYIVKTDNLRHVIIKHVRLPDQEINPKNNHPRGWNTELSHQRKIKSYEVETAWYQKFSSRCDDTCRVPKCYGLKVSGNECFMVLEDLDDHGFPDRKTSASLNDMRACLKWLANFHARFLSFNSSSDNSFDGLWQSGGYWHLATRPDEFAALKGGPLKSAADKIDQLLEHCPYRTLLYGDAKLANFCFSIDGHKVAALDFQYVGAGCGMKDVVYFIGSCLDEQGCEERAEKLLDYYFECLKRAIDLSNINIQFEEVEAAWRPLFAVAWADFHRFLKGWSPDHWKLHGYSERMTNQVLLELGFLE